MPRPVSDETGLRREFGGDKAYRGGSFHGERNYTRAAYRAFYRPENLDLRTGVRPVRAIARAD